MVKRVLKRDGRHVDFNNQKIVAAILKAMDAVGYTGPVTLEMIPFSRLPDMVLPDLELAEKTAGQLLAILS